MSSLFRFSALVALVVLSGCSTAPSPRQTDLGTSVARTRAAIISAQKTASSLRSRDPATSAQIGNLQQQLATVGASFDVTTAKVQWFSQDWSRLNTENGTLKSTLATKDATIATQQKVIHQTAKERDFYPWLIAFGVGWVMLRKLTPVLSAGLKLIPYIGLFLAMAAPEIAFALGAALGFTGARLVAAYGSRFLP